MKIFFQKILNEVLKKISADAKADIKQQEIKKLVAVSCVFL